MLPPAAIKQQGTRLVCGDPSRQSNYELDLRLSSRVLLNCRESRLIGLPSHTAESHEIFRQFSVGRIQELTQVAMNANDVLKIENSLFEGSLKKYRVTEPVKINRLPSKEASQTHSSTSERIRSVSRASVSESKGSISRHHGRSPLYEKKRKLLAVYKCEIIHAEIERIELSQTAARKVYEVNTDKLKADLEELLARIEWISRQRYEFNRDVVNAQRESDTRGSLSRSLTTKGPVPAEKVVRYFEAHSKFVNSYVIKTRLKNNTLRDNIKRISQIIRQKAELGDILTGIDFKQLQIENATFLEKIEDRNKDFTRMKLNNTECHYRLTKTKNKVHSLVQENMDLRRDIDIRMVLMERMDAEIAVVERERRKADIINNRKRRDLSRFKIPSVEVAIRLYGEVTELKKLVIKWRRKVNIAQLEFNTQKRFWGDVKVTAKLDSRIGSEDARRVLPPIMGSL